MHSMCNVFLSLALSMASLLREGCYKECHEGGSSKGTLTSEGLLRKLGKGQIGLSRRFAELMFSDFMSTQPGWP